MTEVAGDDAGVKVLDDAVPEEDGEELIRTQLRCDFTQTTNARGLSIARQWSPLGDPCAAQKAARSSLASLPHKQAFVAFPLRPSKRTSSHSVFGAKFSTDEISLSPPKATDARDVVGPTEPACEASFIQRVSGPREKDSHSFLTNQHHPHAPVAH